MNSPQRIIAHLDLDTFFVSVELLNHPEYAGKPAFVGGRDRGVVTSASYEARAFGVRSGMPSRKALQLCPHAIVLGWSRGEYSRYSRWVTKIIAAKAPLCEKASVDEFYIDLTGMQRFFDPLQWTIDLRKQIMDETKLPISFGLASNKMMAKIATDEAKPNGYLQVPFGKEKEFLAPMKVSKIPGVGEHTYEVLKSMSIHTIKDISEKTVEELEERLGKWGIDLWYKSQGIHHGEVSNYHEAKSISSEHTFNENKLDMDYLKSELVRLTEKIAYELRQDGKVAGCVAVKIRYHDFETVSRQTTVTYTCADDEIIPVVKELFDKLYKKGEPVRLLGVRLSELTNDAIQTNLFNDVESKKDLYKAIDNVKERFGKAAVKRASSN
ncbi:MAG: DNA polymerase IV [Ferruginibacter sp.]